MNYPCGIIKNLLPLYIDDVCNEESKQAVQNHLAECEKCRSCYEAMKSTDVFTEKRKSNSEDNIIESSLKNIKKRINRKIRNIVLCAAPQRILCKRFSTKSRISRYQCAG